MEKRIAKLQNELKKNPSDKKKQEEFKQAITASDQLTIKARDDLNEVLAWEEANRVKDHNESMNKSINEGLDYLKKNPSDQKKREEVDLKIRFLRQESERMYEERMLEKQEEEEEEERIWNEKQTGFRDTDEEREIREMEMEEEKRIQEGYEELESMKPLCSDCARCRGSGECSGCKKIFCTNCLNEDWICGRCSGKWDAEAKERADDDLSCA